jgi:hypothetical protein
VNDAKKAKSFWQSVRELAAMRRFIDPERRRLSGVREFLSRDPKDDPWRDM